jgi:hypothetical protein
MPGDGIFPTRQKVEPSTWRSKLSYRLGKAGRRASEWASNAKQSIKDAPKNIVGGLARVWDRGKEAFQDVRQTARNIGAGFRIDNDPGFGAVAEKLARDNRAKGFYSFDTTTPRGRAEKARHDRAQAGGEYSKYRTPVPANATKNERAWQHMQDFEKYYKDNPTPAKSEMVKAKEQADALRREKQMARQRARDEYFRKYRGAPPPQQQRPK